MLVLSRKASESIVIGDCITVTVLNVGRGRVRIGVNAPSSVRINRVEIAEPLPWPAGGKDAKWRQADSSDAAAPSANGRSAISRRISPAM
jgi:carbon storage regulator CsrA